MLVKISDQTRHTHWPPTAQGTHYTLRLTKKGEGMARALKLSRIAAYAARMDVEWAMLFTEAK